MERLVLLALLVAKRGKEQEVSEFLKSARQLVLEEVGMIAWSAFFLDSGTYGIFDTFADEAGGDAHLGGKIAAALFARAEELFSEPPKVFRAEILATRDFA
jgi:quinol monooxygenase YgiN